MNGRIPYGYQIQNGMTVVVPREADNIRRVYALYLAGKPKQIIADILNAEKASYRNDSRLWTFRRVELALRNPRYIGEQGYPPIIDEDTFRSAQKMQKERSNEWKYPHPALCLQKKLYCENCRRPLRRIQQIAWNETLRFHCDHCGVSITIPDAELLAAVRQQAVEHEQRLKNQSETYTPSEKVIRLTNAINRGLETPKGTEKVIELILQGISARYESLPEEITRNEFHYLIKREQFDQAVSYITIAADNTVKVTFKERH